MRAVGALPLTTVANSADSLYNPVVMHDALGRGRYVRPQITDHGDLVALTSAMPLLYGPAADPTTRDMSFSGTPSGGGGTTSAAGGSTPAAADPAITPATTGDPTTVGGGHAPAGSTPTGGGAPYAGGGGGGDPGGGSLPFSGYAAGVVAAIGTGLVAVGAGVRRVVRGSRVPR
jgi:hypothetical protein